MMRVWKIAMCLAGCLALNAGLRAASVASVNVSTNNPLPGDPYAPIVTRNVFNLVPPPPPPDPNPPEPPKNIPKITPTGIQSINGLVKVLFKASGGAAKPGQPANKDEYFILPQGQRKEGIEVVKIDQQNGIITFDNHGIMQTNPLVNAPSSGGAPAASAPGANNPGMAPAATVASISSGSPGIIRFGGGSGTRSGSAGTGANNPNRGPNGPGPNGANGASVGLNFGASTQGRTYQPEPSNLTPDQTAIMIEIQRAQLMNSPHPAYPPSLLPPTPLTELNTSGGSP
jgi:hypothetical protein